MHSKFAKWILDGRDIRSGVAFECTKCRKQHVILAGVLCRPVCRLYQMKITSKQTALGWVPHNVVFCTSSHC